jgi:hypothetical protein
VALPDPLTISGTDGDRLAVPTPEHASDGETTHPSIVHLDQPVSGFVYWMAHTPYPAGDDEFEDPCIVASNDGIAWAVPEGLVNPLDDQPGSPGAYNSDVDLRYVDGVFYLFWRTLDPAATGAEESIYCRTSADGLAWDPKVLVYTSDQSVRRLLSPCFLFEAGAWVMWAVDIVPSPNQAVRVQGSAAVTGPWADPVGVDMGPMQSGKEPWHLGLIATGDGYVGVLNDCTQDLSGRDGDLLFITSPDGLTFANSRVSIIPREQPGEHDQLYRATILPDTLNGVDGYRMWYGAWLLGPPQVWHIYRTWVGPPADTPGPVIPPPGYGIPVIRQSVTHLGVNQRTGRIIAELLDATGQPARNLSAYANAELSIPLAGDREAYVSVEDAEASTDGASGALVAVVNGLPMWMGLPIDRAGGSDKSLSVPTVTPEGYLAKRRVRDHSFFGTDRAQVAYQLALDAELVDGAYQGLGLEFDVELTGDLIDIEYKATDRTTVYDAIRALCVDGLEFVIDLDWADANQTTVQKIMRIRRRIGRVTSIPTAMFQTGDDGAVVSYKLKESWRDGNYANHVTAIGPGQGDDQPASSPAIDTVALASGIPVVELIVEPGNNITASDLLQAHADANLARAKDGTQVIEITSQLYDYPRPGVDIGLGDLAPYKLIGPRNPAHRPLIGERRMTGFTLNPAEATWVPRLAVDPGLDEVTSTTLAEEEP